MTDQSEWKIVTDLVFQLDVDMTSNEFICQLTLLASFCLRKLVFGSWSNVVQRALKEGKYFVIYITHHQEGKTRKLYRTMASSFFSFMANVLLARYCKFAADFPALPPMKMKCLRGHLSWPFSCVGQSGPVPFLALFPPLALPFSALLTLNEHPNFSSRCVSNNRSLAY